MDGDEESGVIFIDARDGNGISWTDAFYDPWADEPA
jgi:hypothetical protein